MKHDFKTRLFLFGLFFILSFFCLSFYIIPVSASVVVGETSTSTTGGPIISKTWSHTVSGTNRLLVVGIGTRDYASVSSVTYGGVALTRSTTVSLGSGNYPHDEIWYLLAPTVGTANIVVTLSTSDWPTCGAITFTGVNQTTPIRASSNDTTSSSSTTTTSLTIDPTVSGDLVIDSVSYWSVGEYPTAGSGQSILAPAKIDNAWSHSMSVKTATTTTTTTTWNISSTAGWAQSGFSLVPAPTPLVISATAPINNAYIKSPPTASFTFSSTATSASIVFTRTGGTADGATHTCTLIGTTLTAGSHTNLSLENAVVCSGWTALVDGAIYTVTFNAADGAGNATPVVNTGIIYDATLPIISNTSPATNAIINSEIVSYTLSETVSTASITFTRTGGTADGTTHVCTLLGTALASGAHTNLTLANAANICSGWTSLVSGSIYTIVFRAIDLAGNYASTVAKTGVIFGFFSGSGSGTSGSPYLITTCTQLQEMKYNLSAYYNLSNNIDCSGVPNLVTIGIYTGVFNGNNYAISNITMTPAGSGTYMGLFSKISACTIQNLTLTNITVSATSYTYVGILAGAMDPIACTITNVNVSSGSVSGANYVGGLIGLQNTTAGTITNCSSAASINASGNGIGGLIGRNKGTITGSNATGQVAAMALYAGGLVGWNEGTISKSYARGSVTGVATYAGGLVGLESGTILNTYAMGNVAGTDGVGGCIGRKSTLNVSVTNSYSKGLITSSGTNVGGFIGLNEGTGTINSCYYDTTTSGKSDTGKGTPKVTADMKLRYTFSGWDFTTVLGNKSFI